FAAVLSEFRDTTLRKSAVLESVGRQVHGVTGGQMQEFAGRLRAAAPRPLTEEQILAWVMHITSGWGSGPNSIPGRSLTLRARLGPAFTMLLVKAIVASQVAPHSPGC